MLSRQVDLSIPIDKDLRSATSLILDPLNVTTDTNEAITSTQCGNGSIKMPTDDWDSFVRWKKSKAAS
jgi:hypothetical protein